MADTDPFNPPPFSRASSEAEWLEDFSAPPWSESELDQILARADNTNDVQLRQLVGSLRGQRWIIESLLTQIEANWPSAPPDDPLLTMAKNSINWRQ